MIAVSISPIFTDFFLFYLMYIEKPQKNIFLFTMQNYLLTLPTDCSEMLNFDK